VKRYKEMPRFEGLDKKGILKEIERDVSYRVGLLLQKLRVDREFIRGMDPMLISGLRRLFGPYTQGMLMPYLEEVSKKSGIGDGYILMLKDILSYSE